jgi:hypothetical protein
MIASHMERTARDAATIVPGNCAARLIRLLGLLLVLALVIAPGYALAGGDGQSCSTPEVLAPGYEFGGDTQLDGNPIAAVGALASPANDHIYAFTASVPDGFINMISADFDFALYLVANCTGDVTPAPIAYVTQDAHAVLAFSGLTVGETYFVIISGDPNAGTGPDATGSYRLYLPVASAAGNDGGLACASAQQLLPGHTYTGNTASSSNFISEIGGVLPSPAYDEIYAFTANDLGGFLYIDSADYDFGVFLTDACEPPNQLFAAVSGRAPAILDLSGLTAGQTYYVIVSGDPGADASADGEYSLSILPPPDTVFSDGFDGRD